jgi:formylglycine-generating enzyme required for sulfatase activity
VIEIKIVEFSDHLYYVNYQSALEMNAKRIILPLIILLLMCPLLARAELSASRKGMVLVKGGCYHMGDAYGIGASDKKPVHEVCLDNFYIDKTEVTQRAYRKQTDKSPSHSKNCDKCPVEQVNWHKAKAYCENAGKRLPTEAEWEYAARNRGNREKYAGTSGSPDEYAWYEDNSGKRTHPVGKKKPNGLGIYDMSGNVWEWVNDWYDEKYYERSPLNNPQGPSSGKSRVLRGGSWFSEDDSLHSSNRGRSNPAFGRYYSGFRCADTPD